MLMIFFLEPGYGDVTYNARRNILGAIGLQGKIEYHLFSIQSGNQKDNHTLKLLRKARWHPKHLDEFSNFTNFVIILTDILKTRESFLIFNDDYSYSLLSPNTLDVAVVSLDFNTNGEVVATLDKAGSCLISDINTHSCNFSIRVEKKGNLKYSNFSNNPHSNHHLISSFLADIHPYINF